MELSRDDRRLLAALEDGLPLTGEPFAALAERLGWAEERVREDIDDLQARGVIQRFGIVVNHRKLGYDANAMVVWEAPSETASDSGRKLAALPYVTLAYRRTPRPPLWPYTLYAMIHGRDRGQVEALIEEATAAADLSGVRREVLFSKRCFKQRGARYRRELADG